MIRISGMRYTRNGDRVNDRAQDTQARHEARGRSPQRTGYGRTRRSSPSCPGLLESRTAPEESRTAPETLADYDEPLMTLLRFMDLAAILFLLAGIVALIAVLTM